MTEPVLVIASSVVVEKVLCEAMGRESHHALEHELPEVGNMQEGTRESATMVVWYANAGRRWRWRKMRLAHRWHCGRLPAPRRPDTGVEGRIWQPPHHLHVVTLLPCSQALNASLPPLAVARGRLTPRGGQSRMGGCRVCSVASPRHHRIAPDLVGAVGFDAVTLGEGKAQRPPSL
uniref:Uncharacterized protein n=1 Tax=Oryza barthii TaxID=65489 RepID=A0A0D3FTI8_9ORYZ